MDPTTRDLLTRAAAMLRQLERITGPTCGLTRLLADIERATTREDEPMSDDPTWLLIRTVIGRIKEVADDLKEVLDKMDNRLNDLEARVGEIERRHDYEDTVAQERNERGD